MYQGEANVSEEDLNNFLEIAEDLNMRGLSEKNTDYQRSMKDNISQVENNISQIEDNISQVEDNISQVEDDISQVNLKTSYPSGIDNYNEDFVETFFDNDIDTKPLIVPEGKKIIKKVLCIRKKISYLQMKFRILKDVIHVASVNIKHQN